MRQNFYKYTNLVKNDTSYGRKMLQLSNLIFGEPTRPTNRKSMKVVKVLSQRPFDKDPWFVDWYPRHVETHQLTQALRSYGLYRDEHQDFKEEIQRMKALKGKDWMKNLIEKLAQKNPGYKREDSQK